MVAVAANETDDMELSPNRPRVWFQMPPKRLSSIVQSTTLVAMSRPIALLRPKIDVIVLPQDQVVKEFFDFCCDALDLEPQQVCDLSRAP